MNPSTRSIVLLLGLSPLALNSCADRPIINVGTQYGASAHGLKDGYPSKVSVGYDRTELAWLPNGGASSMLGGFDAEFSPMGGVAVAEVLATGAAASQEENLGCAATPSDKPFANTLILSTTTRANLGIEAASTDGPSPSFNFGFKRTILALFPALAKPAPQNDGNGGTGLSPSGESLPSAYTDITIHASGLGTEKLNGQGIAEQRRLTGKSGYRVVQTIAMGEAAEEAARNANIGKPLVESVKSRISRKNK